MKRVGIFLVAVALVVGMVGCVGIKYNLTTASTSGGSVTTPGEVTSTYYEGIAVELVAEAEEGYRFVEWTGDVDDIANVEDATTTITMSGDSYITANFRSVQYRLTISVTEGGSVTIPGEGAFTYDAGTIVDLIAEAEEGYQFIQWTGDIDSIVDIKSASTMVTMDGDHTIIANFAEEIRDWYDLDAIRDNLDGDYLLMNDLDSTTAGYTELASPTANQGKGWQPIGSLRSKYWIIVDPVDPFTGSLDGQGYEIRDLFISRPDEDGVGLFGCVGGGGVIQNLGVVNAEVTGHVYVGGLVGGIGWNGGTVDNSYSDGSVTGDWWVGGLVGGSWGTVSNSYSTGSVTGDWWVGGLVGANSGTVSNSYSTGGVTGEGTVGGLVGLNHVGTVSNSYSTGSVTGGHHVGGLVGENHDGTVSNSYYSYDEVLINGRNIITIGALSNEDFEQWLANDKFLDVNERLSQENGYYLINNVNDFKSLLAFGQHGALKFRLTKDLDLGGDPNFYIPYLAGEFDGNGHKISKLGLNFGSISQVGLFGYLASGGEVAQVGVENANITTDGADVGGLAGFANWDSTVSNSYSTGSVTGRGSVGGLMGWNHGTVSNSYSSGGVTGGGVGGLVGKNTGTVSNSYYNHDEVLINGENVITIGALFDEDFEQWLANDKFLDVSERLSQEHGYYLINNVNDFKQLLVFGQDDSLKFRLKDDLDLDTEANFYIPYLAGEFDGNGHKISNLSFSFDFISQVGLFGYLADGGKVTGVGVDNVTISGGGGVGGLVGSNWGTVSNSYSSGSMIHGLSAGGLVGENHGTVGNSYSTGSVTGEWDVGGLVGWNDGTVRNSYYSYDEVFINGKNIVTIGALFAEDFEQWLANDKFLDVNERLSQEDGYYLINNVNDFKQLLAFGQDDSLKFRLKDDLDLANEANFYIPYLAGEFDGNGHKISNLSFSFDFVSRVGLFGYLAFSGKVTQVGVENVNIIGCSHVGSLVGWNSGTVSNSYASGRVSGDHQVGGLVGWNHMGTASKSYFTSSVTGEGAVGGLMGWNHGTVSNSFWDRETSGMEVSDGGTGKTTEEMQDITTFTRWDIVAVAPGETNLAYAWNIVDGETYAFLSWQSLS